MRAEGAQVHWGRHGGREAEAQLAGRGGRHEVDEARAHGLRVHVPPPAIFAKPKIKEHQINIGGFSHDHNE